MATTLYTVSFTNNGATQVSRYFQTLRGARNWMRFCLTLSGTTDAAIHKGSAGGELIERKSAR